MRFVTVKLMVLLAMLFAVVGCMDEDTYYTEEAAEAAAGEYGYLSLVGLNVSLLSVTEEWSGDSDYDSDESNNDVVSVATRSGESDYRDLLDEELDECWLTIVSTNLKEAVSLEMSYDDFYSKSLESEDIEGYQLVAGQYDITIDSKKPADLLTEAKSVLVSSASEDELGEPMYRGYGAFEIKGSEVTEFGVDDAIKCDINNVKASVAIAADLKALFKPTADLDVAAGDIPLNVSITMGNMTYIFDGSEEDDTFVYFDQETTGATCDESGNYTIDIVLSGMYNTAAGDETESYSKIEGWKQSLTDVQAGQSRKIGVGILYANEGNVEFKITVESWTYNETLDIDIMSAYANDILLMEEVIIDLETLPRIELIDGGDDNTRFIAKEETGVSLEYRFTPRDESTIASISATTPTLLSGAEMVWSAEDGDLGEFSEYFTASVEAVSNRVSLTATAFGLETLMANDASHVTTFTVIDSKGRESVDKCTVNVGDATAPIVVWRDKDITQAQEITADGLDFIIDIESSTAITGFTVDIVSDVLDAEELLSVNLNAHMDLAYPDSSYEAGLISLGFPTGSDILGKTSMVFDVSSFMPMLYLFGEGESTFILTITNSAGISTVAPAMVYVAPTTAE
ncbi:MAG: DUF4493 domain-containing protein [Rikenellaceae bacterium]